MKNLKIFFLILLTTLTVACGANKSMDAQNNSELLEKPVYEESSNNSIDTVAESVNPDMEMQEKGISRVDPSRKIIVSYNMTFDTEKYVESMNEINKFINENQAYKTWVEESNYGLRVINLSINVPSDKVNKFIEEISSIKNLNLLTKSLNSQDITDQYRDIELRLKTLNEKLNRLNELKKQQSSLEELLKVETEITDTIYEIEQFEGNKKGLDKQIDYTAFYITVSEVGLNNTSQTKTSFGSRISFALKDSLKSFVNFMQNLVINLIYLFPLIIFLAFVILIIKFIFRKYKFSKRLLDKKINKKENTDK